MNPTDQIARKQDAILSEIKKLRIGKEDKYLMEKDAAKFIGVAVSTIRDYRRKGLLIKWRCRPSGRGIQYLQKELENFLITSK